MTRKKNLKLVILIAAMVLLALGSSVTVTGICCVSPGDQPGCTVCKPTVSTTCKCNQKGCATGCTQTSYSGTGACAGITCYTCSKCPQRKAQLQPTKQYSYDQGVYSFDRKYPIYNTLNSYGYCCVYVENGKVVGFLTEENLQSETPTYIPLAQAGNIGNEENIKNFKVNNYKGDYVVGVGDQDFNNKKLESRLEVVQSQQVVRQPGEQPPPGAVPTPLKAEPCFIKDQPDCKVLFNFGEESFFEGEGGKWYRKTKEGKIEECKGDECKALFDQCKTNAEETCKTKNIITNQCAGKTGTAFDDCTKKLNEQIDTHKAFTDFIIEQRRFTFQ